MIEKISIFERRKTTLQYPSGAIVVQNIKEKTPFFLLSDE